VSEPVGRRRVRQVPRLLRISHSARLVALLVALADAFAAAGLLGAWSHYRSPWAAVALLVVAAALPVAAVAVPRRRRASGEGGFSGRDGVLVVGGVLAVSAGVLADLPPSDWASGASWNWGTGAITLLVLAVHLDPWLITVLAVAHGTLAAGAVLLAGGDPWNAQLALVAATVPPLGAAQYVRLQAGALQRRAAAVRSRERAEADRHDLDVVRVTDVRRLSALVDRIEPLLRDVVDGARLPLDAERSAEARLLARQMRDVLAAQRRTLWLPEQAGGAPVDVVATDSAIRAAGDGDRAWLAALIDLLGTHPCWQHVRVVLDRRLDGSVTAVLTAGGSAAREAAADPRVQALCASRSARCDADDGLLVVEAEILAKIGA